MDDVATYTYDNHKELISEASWLENTVQMTPGEDGLMPFHTALCLRSYTNGNPHSHEQQYFFVIAFVSPLIWNFYF